jgi:flagellar hook assembly protein FlgD
VKYRRKLRLRIYPNPTPGRTSVQFTLPREGPVRIAVYDVAGREVRSIVDGPMPAGTWTRQWDGRGNEGRAVAAGVYFLRMETATGSRSSKITLVR